MWEWEEYPGIVSQSRGRRVLWSQDYARTFQRQEKKKFVFVGGGGQWLEVIQLVNYLFIDISNNAFQSLSTSV